MKKILYKLLFEAKFYSKNDFLIFIYKLVDAKKEDIDKINNKILWDVYCFLNKKDENENTIYELLNTSTEKKQKDAYSKFVYEEVNKKYQINLDKLNDYYEYMLDFIEKQDPSKSTSYDEMIRDFDYFEKNIKNSLMPELKKSLIDEKNPENLKKIIRFVRQIQNEKQSEFDAMQNINKIYENDDWVFIHPTTEAQFRYNSFLIYKDNNLQFYKPDSANIDWCTIERHGAGTSSWADYCKKYVCVIAISKNKSIDDKYRKISLKFNRPENVIEGSIKEYFFFDDSPTFDVFNDEMSYKEIIKVFSEDELTKLIEYTNSSDYFNYTALDEEAEYSNLNSLLERRKFDSLTRYIVNNNVYYLFFKLKKEKEKEYDVFDKIIDNVLAMFRGELERFIDSVYIQLSMNEDLKKFVLTDSRIKNYFEQNTEEILEKLLSLRRNKEVLATNPVISYIMTCEDNEQLLDKLFDFISRNKKNENLEKIIIFTLVSLMNEQKTILNNKLKLKLIDYYKDINISSPTVKKMLSENDDLFIEYYNNDKKNIVKLFMFDTFDNNAIQTNNDFIEKIKVLIPDNEIIFKAILALLQRNTIKVDNMFNILGYKIDNILNMIAKSTIDKVTSYDNLFVFSQKYNQILDNFEKFDIDKIKIEHIRKISNEDALIQEQLVKKIIFKKLKTNTLLNSIKSTHNIQIDLLKRASGNDNTKKIFSLIADCKIKIDNGEISNDADLIKIFTDNNIHEVLKKYILSNIYIINERKFINKNDYRK